METEHVVDFYVINKPNENGWCFIHGVTEEAKQLIAQDVQEMKENGGYEGWCSTNHEDTIGVHQQEGDAYLKAVTTLYNKGYNIGFSNPELLTDFFFVNIPDDEGYFPFVIQSNEALSVVNFYLDEEKLQNLVKIGDKSYLFLVHESFCETVFYHIYQNNISFEGYKIFDNDQPDEGVQGTSKIEEEQRDIELAFEKEYARLEKERQKLRKEKLAFRSEKREHSMQLANARRRLRDEQLELRDRQQAQLIEDQRRMRRQLQRETNSWELQYMRKREHEANMERMRLETENLRLEKERREREQLRERGLL